MKRTMRCLLILAVTLALGAMLSGDGWAQGILSTKHNLSPQFGTGTDTRTVKALTQTDTLGVANTEVCVYCHTPHGADTTVNAPLWNRAINTTASAYTMYSSAFSSTYDATTDTQPTGVSLACLSCHDGTIAFDALRNLPGSGGFSATPATDGTRTTWTFAGAAAGKKLPAGVTNIGVDLSNDHPVSMLYSSALSPSSTDPANTNANGFKTEASVTGPVGTRQGGLVLYAGKVQCGSCHDPHRSNTNTFLRKSNDGSELCLTCHRKDG